MMCECDIFIRGHGDCHMEAGVKGRTREKSVLEKGVSMGKDKLSAVRDYIVKNSKFLFPVILIAVVAITVSIALNMSHSGDSGDTPDPLADITPVSVSPEPEATAEPEPSEPQDVALASNEDEAIQTIVNSYYTAMSSGDSAAMAALYDEVSENDLLRYEEMAKYLEKITVSEIYTKPGLAEGITVVYVAYGLCFENHEEEVPGWQTFYVCRNEQGALYIKNEKNFTEEEKEYVVKISAQDDVVELNNRVSVAFNELMEGNQELLKYMAEFEKQVNATVGIRMAEQNTSTESSQEESAPEEGEAAQGSGESQAPEGEEAPAEGTEPPAEESQAPADAVTQYATATTTVNVRSSDSEQADKLGKVPGGEKVEVKEVRVNGWTKIVFEGGDGYIKSEFLQMEESASGQEVVGTVTAKENVKIRAAASEDAEQLGLMVGGDSLELLGTENGWCKVRFDGKVGYVKSDYVTQ